MLTLILDTSTERGLAAIHDGTKLIQEILLPFGIQNAKFLLPAMANFPIHELKRIVVGVGPGSYTGIRAGVIVAKTLSYALKIPLVGICSLEGFVPTKEGKFAALIDAKIGGVYLLIGEKEKDNIHYLSEPFACPLDEIEKHLSNVNTIVTPHQKPLMEKIHLPHIIWEESHPSANAIMQRAIKMPPSKDLKLLYLRKTQAEIEKEKREDGKPDSVSQC